MKRIQSKKGQGLVEYIILIGLIALVVFGLVKTFGSDLSTQFSDATTQVNKISGAYSGGSGGGGG